MTIAFRQSPTPVAPGTAPTSLTSNALASAALAKSIIEVWVSIQTGTTITGVTDSASQTYTLQGSITDTADATILACYACTNNASLTALTATASFSGASNFPAISIREITGAVNANCLTSSFPSRLITPGTATDGITIPLTYNAPALISAFCGIEAGSGTGSTLTGGTGFATTAGWSSNSEFSHPTFATKRVTVNNSPATFTDATNGGSCTYLAAAVVWQEVTSIALPPLPRPRRIFINSSYPR